MKNWWFPRLVDMFHCVSLVLPRSAAIKRESRRPVVFRPSGFDEEFDSLTLFYDLIVFSSERGNNLIFIAPPFLNLFASFCQMQIAGRPLGSTISNYYLRDRCSEVWIPGWNGESVLIDFDFGSYDLTPKDAANHLYKGKRVLYTLSKNNEMTWIIDWLRFHARNHDANAALIYDNGSTQYRGQDLEKSLKVAFPKLEINVVHWPYKYGPQGISKDTGWDSDFCQAAAFQDARFRFLNSAASVLNCDIDEFVLSTTGESIFAATEGSKTGCTIFGGKWISNATVSSQPALTSSTLRHGDFRYSERTAANDCPMKWCVVPQRCRLEDQWRTHTVSGKDLASCYSNAFSYRHFRSISTNWKYQRYQPAVFDPKLHEFDEALHRALLHSGLTPRMIRRRGSLSELVRQIRRRRKPKPACLKPLAVDHNDPALGGNMIGGDPNTFHPALWSFLIKRFSVASILDVGCGEGHCVKYCSALGVRAFGFDALKANIERAVAPIALHDLRLGPFVMPVDLVLCCEVVEHIEEKYLPNVLRTLANGRVIAITHALPEQTGYHHVNCQPSTYWIEQLEAVGYRFLPQETAEGKSRIKASGRWTYFVQSGLIFERQ